MNIDVMIAALPKLLEGAWLSLQLLFISGFFGLMIAVPLSIARSSPRLAVKALPYAYIFFFRGTPLLVQLFLVYYGLSQFAFVRESPILWPVLKEPYWCAIITFSLHTGGYIAEILRGAIQAVPVGEVEAARALGMRRSTTLARIVLPRAARIALPAYGNELILMLKGSALASTVTLLDLTGMARTIIARNYMPVETFLMAGVIYMTITFVLVRGLRFIEHRTSAHMRGRPTGPDTAPPESIA
ncbi:ABC transporter permease [Roseospira marina]|uniref:ABC transporter permease n=1 Tax=Roseospira marina TaxID=140057 RepID=A0A5M6ICV1_9PROT|nr:ABC transporter permease [Roseospira marina]KAA5605589.1 ABC transporter permease [Roseospira marina]MBB4313344.1 polar amino acid transport system permease protein [Roseospira marina]MBB5085915.1 polar amino acid transport system permease protein [Roseospira marina]